MKKLSKFLLSTVFIFTCLGTASCKINYGSTISTSSTATTKVDSKIDVEGIEFSSKTYDYDGNSHSVEVTGLPDGVNVTYENNNKTHAGTYEVIAKLEDTTGKYNIPSQLKSTLTINKKEFTSNDFKFESKEVTYDGKSHSLEVIGLPEGVNVTYKNNNKINAGTYEVVAKLEDTTGNYIIPTELKATLTINKKELTASDLTFDSVDVTYDGSAHSIEVLGLPEGINVSYENNDKVKAGKYEVVAKLEDTTGNYNIPNELKSTLTINKKEISASDLTFDDLNVVYDGKTHSVAVKGLPTGVKVTYENNAKVNVGEYEVVAKLKDTTGNYIIPAELKATLTIDKKDITSGSLSFQPLNVVYDGNVHSLEVKGLPSEIKVTYENNDKVNVGEYEVVAKLEDTTGNYIIPTELKSTLTINKKELTTSDLTFDSVDVTYDGSSHSIEVEGLPEGINVSYENNNKINVGEYEVVAKLEDTTGNYIVPTELKTTLVINKIKIALENNTINLNYTADELFVTLEFTNTLSGVDVSYNLQMEDSMIKEAKTYLITVNVLNDIYELEDNNLTVIVTKEKFTVTFKNENFDDAVYDVYFGDDLVLNNPPFEKTGYNPIYDLELDNLKNIRNNIVINVTLEAKKFKLTYNLGFDTSDDKTIDVYYDQVVTLPSLDLTGYKCVGYEDANSGSIYYNNFTYNFLDDVKMYAKYEFMYTYTISSFYDSSTDSYIDGMIITGLSQYGSDIIDLNIPEYGYVWDNNVCTRYEVRSIGSQAFRNNTNLISITLPRTLESITGSPFYGCNKVSVIYYNAANLLECSLSQNIGTSDYSTKGLKLVIGEHVEEIPSNFMTDSYLREIDASNATSLKTIGECAFYSSGSYYLTNVTLPSSVQTIDNYAFSGNRLMNLDMSVLTNLKTIGEKAFYRCSIKNIIIGENVTSIGNNAFTECSNVNTINYNAINCNTESDNVLPFSNIYSDIKIIIGSKVEVIGSYVFYGSYVSSVDFTNNILLTKIGNYAFGYCKQLTSLSLPNSVETIGDSAFSYCSKLTTVILPNSLKTIGEFAFIGNALMELDMSVLTNLTTIGRNAFEGCSSLYNIIIGENVTSIGSNAFYNCSNVFVINYDAKNISYSPSNTSNPSPYLASNIGANVYSTKGLKLVIGEHVEAIPSCFMNESYLTEIDASNAKSLKTIGTNAFYSLSHLTNVTLSSSIETIEESAFKYNHIMELDMSVLTNLKTIGESAFNDCSSLDNITIGKYVTSIGSNAFYNCSNVYIIYYDAENIVNSSNSAYLSNNIGKNVYSTKGLKLVIGEHVEAIPSSFMHSSYLTVIDASNAKSLKTIGTKAFYGLSHLTNVTLSSSIETIGESAFDGNSLMELDMSVLTNLKTIGIYAFEDCSSIDNITIGENVTSIGNKAFSGCSNVAIIYYNAENSSISEYSFTNLGKNVFETNGLKLVVGETVEVIPSKFMKNSYLTNIDASKATSLKTICENAFSSCSYLSKISFGNSVKTIDNYAFNGCNKLETVYYYGSSTEWDLISIGSNNSKLLNATRYYK